MNRLNKALVISGILLIVIGIASVPFLGQIVGRIGILGFVLIVIGIFIPELKTTGKKSAEKLNFREKDSADNCMNCKYCDMKFFDGFEAGCKWFEIKVNDGYVCDLFIRYNTDILEINRN